MWVVLGLPSKLIAIIAIPTRNAVYIRLQRTFSSLSSIYEMEIIQMQLKHFEGCLIYFLTLYITYIIPDTRTHF